jgi:4-amino-4-deoxy-L-arabinose transferase-like glycosyltransferase
VAAARIESGVRLSVQQLVSQYRADILPVALVLLLASFAFARLLAIPAFEDEGTQLRWIWRILERGEWLAPLDAGKPLEAWPMVPLLQLGLPTLRAIRAVHVVAGMLGGLLMYCFARQLADRWSALACGTLFALCPFVVYLQRFALSDMLMCTAGLWVLVAVAGYLDSQRWPQTILLGAGLVVMALSKMPVGFVGLAVLPLALLLMPASRRRALLQRPHWRALQVAHAPVLLLLLLVAIAAAVRALLGRSPGFGLLSFAGLALGNYHDIAAVMGVSSLSVLGELVTQLSWPVVVIAALGLIAGLILNDWRERWLIALGLLPLLAIGLGAHFWYSRYLLFALPPLILAAVAGWRALALRAGDAGRAVAFSAWLLCLLYMGHQSLLLVLNPLLANWSPVDRFQYFEGWGSGYGYPEAANFILAAPDPPAEIFSLDGHSAYQLRCYLPRWWAARVHPVDQAPDGARLQSPQTRLDNLLRSPAWILIPEQLLQTYLDSSFGDAYQDRFALHRVASFAKPGARVELTLYEVKGRP